jgi:16S rRNA G966 N2-methylase RsmD
MDKQQIQEKFAGPYEVTEVTYLMGTHHLLADQIAQRFRGYQCVLDACMGAGFMSIALAHYVPKILGVEKDPQHFELAKHNIQIAGLSDVVDCWLGDIQGSSLLARLANCDAAFLDPEWNKAGDSPEKHTRSLHDMQPPADDLVQVIMKITPNIALRLPKEIDKQQLDSLGEHELEENCLQGELKFYTAYFGKLRIRS